MYPSGGEIRLRLKGRGRRGRRGLSLFGKELLLALARRDEGETRIDRRRAAGASCALIAIPVLVFARTLFPPVVVIRRLSCELSHRRHHYHHHQVHRGSSSAAAGDEGRSEDGREPADRRGLQTPGPLEPEAHLLSQSRGHQSRLDGDRCDIQPPQYVFLSLSLFIYLSFSLVPTRGASRRDASIICRHRASSFAHASSTSRDCTLLFVGED